MNGLFVSNRGFLGDGKGGVQVCTREFIEVIGAAGISLTVQPVDSDRSWSARLLRLADSSPFVRPFDAGLPAQLGRLLARTRFDFVFLNQEFLAPLAPLLRPVLPEECKVVVLSHGLEVTDTLHAIRLRRKLPLGGRFRPSPAVLLGRILLTEQRLREDIDIVCAIAPFDAELETWLGTRRVGWIPRTIPANPLDWRPVRGRFGFVGTLDHGPNLEGLVRVLEVLEASDDRSIHVRVVGSPRDVGGWLKRRFPSIEFLGALDDPGLAAEASTWNAFIHPIFCLPRGCSTKLALGIGWRIPIVTTFQGRRGYTWREGSLLEANDADHFVKLCHTVMDDAVGRNARAAVVQVADSSPSIADVAGQMRELLGLGDCDGATSD